MTIDLDPALTGCVDSLYLRGNYAPTHDEVDVADLLVTGQIPLRLDVGMPLRATVFSRAEPRLHLNIFYQL